MDHELDEAEVAVAVDEGAKGAEGAFTDCSGMPSSSKFGPPIVTQTARIVAHAGGCRRSQGFLHLSQPELQRYAGWRFW